MSRGSWHRPRDVTRQGREATLVQIVETVDRTAPETKADLAERLEISEQYLSELLQELKRDGIVKKGYVVDEAALAESVETVSQLSHRDGDGVGAARSAEVLDLLDRLDEVTVAQYRAARAAFRGDDPAAPDDGGPTGSAEELEGLANERHAAIFSELKSYTLATEWPGNRAAADLATVATNLEIVGDRACFIAAVADGGPPATGVVAERVLDVFAAGERIHDCMSDVLFEGDLDRYEDLRSEEETVHRDLNELFELVTAYDAELYGPLVTVTRALERSIFYWVHSAELAARLHSGLSPEHISL